ncbi:MAG TPA: YceI family protein [Gemmatimonadales bacterium]|nr:YceI family protein [Gemmatimonadales bacterium]
MPRVATVLLALLIPAGVLSPSRVPAHPVRAGLRLIVTPHDNTARYRVREQLARLNFPSDAIGSTSGVSGSITLADDGSVVPAESKITVDISALKSDRDRRDMYVSRRTLETDRFPAVELVPTALHGLPWPLPGSGQFEFQLDGNLTVHGTTHATSWKVVAEATDSGFTGTATTGFTFADFGLDKPQVMIVLSVDDSIHLEYVFHLRRG